MAGWMMSDLKHNEHRYHAELGACRILCVEGRVGFLVALRLNDHSKVISIHAVDTVDERGWGPPKRLPGSVTEGVRKRAIKLRQAGMVLSDIAKEISVSRTTVGRLLHGVPTGGPTKSRRGKSLSEDDKEEIITLLKKGWRQAVIANWIGCHPQSVSRVARLRKKKV